MDTSTSSVCLVLPKEQAKEAKRQLEGYGLLDDNYKLKHLDGGLVAVPIKAEKESVQMVSQLWQGFSLKDFTLQRSKKAQAKLNAPYSKLLSEMLQLMQQYNIDEKLKDEIPKKWERHDDLVIIPSTAFVSKEWERIDNLWPIVAASLSSQRVARHAPVASDGIRSSQVSLLYGKDGWVTHVDNRIRYNYDVNKCMFSAGNVSEKLRVASWDCTGETVIDLFAGIGYFTLPYLVHAKAEHVHACEWNPHAVEALILNLQENGVSHKCTVHQGDCTSVSLPPVADRINLGLIPSSEHAWPTAVRVLSWKGGVLHIHANVERKVMSEKIASAPSDNTLNDHSIAEMKVGTEGSSGLGIKKSGKLELVQACHQWSEDAASKISLLLQDLKGQRKWTVQQNHIEVVKSYAPHVVHVVLDLECRPVDCI